MTGPITSFNKFSSIAAMNFLDTAAAVDRLVLERIMFRGLFILIPTS
jgi:hypothetical protein